MSHESREGLWKYSKGRFGTTAGQVTDPTCVQRYDAWKTSTVEKLVGSKTKSKVGPINRFFAAAAGFDPYPEKGGVAKIWGFERAKYQRQQTSVTSKAPRRHAENEDSSASSEGAVEESKEFEGEDIYEDRRGIAGGVTPFVAGKKTLHHLNSGYGVLQEICEYAIV